MLHSLARFVLRNSTRLPLRAVLWARAYLSQGRVLPALSAPRRRRPF